MAASSVFLPSPLVRAQWGGSVSVTALSTAEEILATILVPAGALGSNGQLLIGNSWEFTGSTNAKTLRVRVGAVTSGLGGALLQEVAQATAASISQRFLPGLQAVDATHQIGVAGPSTITSFGAATTALPTFTLDSTAVIEINITGQKATGSETLTLRAYSVQLLKP